MSKTYSGFYCKQERWADNGLFYKSLIRHPCPKIGIDREKAIEELNFSARPPPDMPHDRLIAQVVAIYGINNFFWRVVEKGMIGLLKQKKLIVVAESRQPDSLEKILSLDFGTELQHSEEPFEEVVLHKEEVVYFPDGTFLRGQRIKKVPKALSPFARAEPYIDVTINRHSSYSCYNFSFKETEITLSTSKPLEFHVTSYVSIDGERIQEKKDVIRPGFERGHDDGTHSFKKWVTRAT